MGDLPDVRAHRTMSNLLAVAVLIVMNLACSRAGGASSENQPFRVSTSQMFVTVENQAGLPLSDIKVGIVPASRATTFTASWSRLDTNEKRDFSLREFRDQGGTQLNLRIHRPRSVVVSGVDINMKKYEAEQPW